MSLHVLLGLPSTEVIIIIVIAAVVLFGADKLPKLARSAGAAKKEFMIGQAEADEAAERAREQARLRAQAKAADPMENVSQPNAGGVGENVPAPAPDRGPLGS